ncbi:multi-copper oxidase protein family (plasmid) [Alkalihalophilus pseudofirmus OF4]|uniref:Multi-copper oxidase protein family n=4 Tax=Bacillaceae TaxID=186817 RepID=D3G168_ALKPO|nr:MULTISPECIES: multicopper oxidase family protein [Bacillaceae]MDX5476058.1 multicopper oxidase domain-containing protein [Bacillaceae bacterium]ADC52094.1 multi-copper oxidase protein family [Alkalihalophilus pseudofirmus OF4]KHF38296.1 multicopper oxidase [Halalkalibacter okhensis]GAE28425.1 multicopper oxidase [Halalkalibacter wakoensis JCM 9140]GAE32734.1 multicopper oxidase [Halalkalibacter hemicellulosilyticusJCM 9152]
MKKPYGLAGIALALSLVIAGCSNDAVDHSAMGHGESQQEEQTQEATTEDGKRVFDINVTETHWMFNDEIMDDAWTYNGSLPGQEIRVQEGDTVILNVTNSLDEPTALHLHGFPVPNEMDGVPGVTQNAILPGEQFTYEYQADVPGTYWYHSHQDGSKQVGKGLYGVFIVESSADKSYDVDEVIVIDEWSSMGTDMSEMDHGDMDMGEMSEMDHGDMDMSEMNDMDHGDMDGVASELSHADMMNEMYDTPLINGKASPAIEAIEVEEGNKVKLRFVNAGLFTQVVSIPGHSFKITHYDGQPVNGPELLNDTAFRIAPAERYEVEVEMKNPGAWGIQVFAEENEKTLNTVIPVIYDGYEDEELQENDSNYSFFDLTTYGQAMEQNLGVITKEYDMLLGTEDGGETFTINDKQFPDHEIYEVEEGDIVKFTIVNDTEVDHPMHLHGEFFNVISKDGNPIQGSPILKDTLNVKPGETYEIVFEANNPGNWMFHCHEFHHASGGMVAEVRYKGYEPTFTLDPTIPNTPE